MLRAALRRRAGPDARGLRPAAIVRHPAEALSERPPTSHDVARLAGVSQPTVSRALRDAAGVSTATKRAVRDAADELDSIPSHRGRSLSTRRAGQIALVIGDLGSPFYLEILQAADAVLRDAGQRMLVMTPDAVDDALAPRLLDGSLDGTILTTGVALADGRTRRGPYSFAFGRETAPALLETGPTALFCADDVVALGAYNAMASRGVDVPRDVSLVGFDDISLASWEVFQLTTVRGDPCAWCRRRRSCCSSGSRCHRTPSSPRRGGWRSPRS